jgi:hypothetical protein
MNRSTLPGAFLTLSILGWGLACSQPTKRSDRSDPARVDQGVASIPRGAPLVLSSTLRVTPGDYLRPPLDGTGSGDGGVIVIRGMRDLVLDLTGVDLRGTPRGTDLDENRGVGILVRDCEDVTLRGGRIGGYKTCLRIESSSGIVVEDIAFEGWYGQRLRSTAVAEHEGDWIYPHENDNDEWSRNYGGALSFIDCSRVTVRRCRGRSGQNGILFTRTTGSKVYDNDFSEGDRIDERAFKALIRAAVALNTAKKAAVRPVRAKKAKGG